MDKNKTPKQNVIPFANRNNHISPSDLEDILEDLEDLGYLSDAGKDFRFHFWKLFIKRRDEIPQMEGTLDQMERTLDFRNYC